MRIALLFVAVSIGAAPVHAQLIKKLSDLDPTNKNSGIRQAGRDADRARLDATSPDTRAGRDYTKVYVQNDTGKKLWVATYHQPYKFSPGNGEATVGAASDADTDPFDLRYWMEFAPGEKALVGNTHNPRFYVFAKDVNGMQWGGKSLSREIEGKEIGFSLELIQAGQVREHTITLRGNGKLVAALDMTPPKGKTKMAGASVKIPAIVPKKKAAAAAAPDPEVAIEIDSEVTLTNKTDLIVRFSLIGRAKADLEIQPGATKTFAFVVDAKGGTLAVNQLDGTTKRYKVTHGAFNLRQESSGVIVATKAGPPTRSDQPGARPPAPAPSRPADLSRGSRP